MGYVLFLVVSLAAVGLIRLFVRAVAVFKKVFYFRDVKSWEWGSVKKVCKKRDWYDLKCQTNACLYHRSSQTDGQILMPLFTVY